ncbi:MAG: PaaI family thioesterase [Sphingomicrobium sp.]
MSLPLHPGAAACFARQGMMTHFGARMTEAAAGRCVIEVDAGHHLTQQSGFFHGGVVAGVADAACGHAAITAAPDGADVVSVEFKLNLLAPADGSKLRASATVLRQGRTISVVAARVETLREAGWVHCAEMLGTMFVKHGQAPVAERGPQG